MRSIHDEIEDLRGMNVPELVERYIEVFGKKPRCKQPTWLFRRIAWRIQEQRFGGLSKTAKARLETLIAEIDVPAPREKLRPGTTDDLGATVTRFWKHREITATRVEGGWEYEGTVFRSLSAIARHVTGTRWNGRLFFGLTKRGGGR